MRIAFIADALDLQYAGIHIYTREILKALTSIDSGHEFIIIRAKAGESIPNAEEIIVPVNPNIPAHQRIRLFTNIPKALAKAKADIVVEPSHFGPFNLPKHIKRVTILHDLTPFLSADFHVFSSRMFHRLLMPGVFRRADHIITVSAHTRDDLITRFPFAESKSTPILLGRDENFVPNQDISILEKYGIHPPYLLYVGTLEPRKNLLVLLRAYEAFRQKSSQVYQLVLVGKKGWKTAALLTAIEASPYRAAIILTGYAKRSDLPVLYSMADIFVYPSLYEGFGLPVLEAMSCGTAVITTNVSSLPEVGGNAALYFQPDAPEQLLDLLLRLSADKHLFQRQRNLSLEQAKQFSWQKTAIEMIRIFESL